MSEAPTQTRLSTEIYINASQVGMFCRHTKLNKRNPFGGKRLFNG